MQAHRITSTLGRIVAVGMVALGFLLGSGVIEGVPSASAATPCCSRPYDR